MNQDLIPSDPRGALIQSRTAKMKYYGVRILAALLWMGSIEAGFLAGAEYGKVAGWVTFIVVAAVGIYLHFVARRIQSGND